MSDKSKIKPKKLVTDLSKKDRQKLKSAERNKMKVYGDIPDERPKGRVLTPKLLEALKRAKKGKSV